VDREQFGCLLGCGEFGEGNKMDRLENSGVTLGWGQTGDEVQCYM